MPTRRDTIKTMASASLLAAANTTGLTELVNQGEQHLQQATQGRIRHAVCRWCFSDTPLEQLCQTGKTIGLEAIDLVAPPDFATVKKYGLQVSMVSPDGLPDYLRNGWNHREHHAKLIDFYLQLIDQTAAAGFKSIICFSGNRNGLDDEQGLINCTQGLQKILPRAEQKGITLVMELLNSKIDHRDYQCDHTAWGVELAKTIGSDRFGLLYDIYHMQIMEGDVIRTIRDHAPYIAHYHTAGVPGRHEIDENQELNYPAIMRAIAETGYQGIVAQEFIPVKTDKLDSLRSAVKTCTI